MGVIKNMENKLDTWLNTPVDKYNTNRDILSDTVFNKLDNKGLTGLANYTSGYIDNLSGNDATRFGIGAIAGSALGIPGIPNLGTGVLATQAFWKTIDDGYITQKEARTEAKTAGKNLKQWSGATNTRQFDYYIRDAYNVGLINKEEYSDGIKAYNKLRSNGYNYNKLSKDEAQALTTVYNDLYHNSQQFKAHVDTNYSKLSDEEKLAYLEGAFSGGFGVPAPAYLDTSFDNYQKLVEPVKHYSNKELAELYNIDYDFDNIKQDLDNAAEAQVNLKDWEAALIANNAERDNTHNITSYLDAIRNIKSEAIQKGMSNGARAAAEVIANQQAINNKVQTNHEAATQRFETVSDALLQRANTQIETANRYRDLANNLSTAGTTLYANDIERYGQDLLANANFLSADENLRSNRIAQNNLMRAIYNNVATQSNIAAASARQGLNYFYDITLPSTDNDVTAAIAKYINTAYAQQTGYIDPLAKWGQ